MEKYIKKINIGGILVPNNVFLAPMAGITDLPFRYICHKVGGVCYSPTEMVSAKGIIYQDKKTHKIMDAYEGEFPHIVQIFGSDENILEQVVRKICSEKKADIIDFNLGCPAPKIVKNGDGSMLLQDLDKVERIIKAITKSSTVPITVKTRKGYFKDTPTAVSVAKICEKYNVAAICIHGRTKEDYYSGIVDKDIIKEVKENVSIPVIANGDIKSVQDAIDMFEYTKADGIMIGRASIGNPWIFKEIIEGKKLEVSKEERLNVIIEHLNLALSREREAVAVPKFRKHLAYYLKGIKDAATVRQKLNSVNEAEEVKNILIEFLKEKEVNQNE